MSQLELRFSPSASIQPLLRLQNARGSQQQTLISLGVRQAGDSQRVELAGGRSLDSLQGVMIMERGIKYSTERGAQHIGFINTEGAFWGETLAAAGVAQFQIYLYLPDELFDRLAGLAVQNRFPHADIAVLKDQGFTPAAPGGAIGWDNVSFKSAKLESVKLDFSLPIA